MLVTIKEENNLPVAYADGKKFDSLSKMEEYLCYHAKDIQVDPESIDAFYAYETDLRIQEYFVVQTPEILAARLHTASANVWKFEINKQADNPKWSVIDQDSLVETGPFGMYVSSEMTPEEYDMVLTGYDSQKAKELTRIYEAITNPELVKQASSRFDAIREFMQFLINRNKQKILSHVLAGMGQNGVAFLHRAEESLDCGWVVFAFRNESWRDVAKTASLQDCHAFADGRFFLDLPFATQSTTIQLMEAEKAAELIKEQSGIELSYTAYLD